MQVSVVIPCHNGAELTERCVDSLLSQRGVDRLEILLVDNGSHDHTARLGAMHPSVRVLRQEQNLGFAGGVNQGLCAASLPFVLVLNNDTAAAPGMLQRLHRAACTDARIGLVAPTSNHVKGEARIPVGRLGAAPEGLESLARLLLEEHGDRVQDVSTLAGLALFGHRDTFRAIGPFDERFGSGNYEDDDYCLRARLLGYRLVIARSAFLHHEGHATFRARGLDVVQEIERRRVQFVAKWRDDPAGAALIADWNGDLATAAALATSAARAHPRWPDGDRLRQRHALAQQRFSAAIAHGEALLGLCPLDSAAVVDHGFALLGNGEHETAQRWFEHALSRCFLTPGDAGMLLCRLGQHARARGRLDEAIANFAAAVDLAPDEARLQHWLGLGLLEAGRLPAAITTLERALAAGRPDAHVHLGICHRLRGDPTRADWHFTQARAAGAAASPPCRTRRGRRVH